MAALSHTGVAAHFLPQLGIAPNSRIDVACYDFRGGNGFAPDVYYTYSDDVTWAKNVKVTDKPIDFFARRLG